MKSTKRSAALAFLLGCALVLLIAEGVVRIVPPTNRFVTYGDVSQDIWEPNSSFVWKGGNIGEISDFRVRKHTNSLGFADREFTVEKRAGTVRILVLGDSQVEALQVPLELSYHKLLESRLRSEGRQVEVIALGRSGNGVAEALKLYRDLGSGYDPDFVVWGFTDVNDVTDAHPRLTEMIVGSATGRLLRPPHILYGSVLASLFFSRDWRREAAGGEVSGDVAVLLPGRYAELAGDLSLRHPVYLDAPPPLYAEAIRFFERDLSAFLDEIRNDGLPALVVSTAGGYDDWLARSYPGFEWRPRKLDELAARISRAKGARFSTMKTILGEREASERGSVVFRRDGHLNQRGHRMVAEMLYPEISAALFDR